MAEGTRLLSEYGGQTPSRVRIPPSPLSRPRGLMPYARSVAHRIPDHVLHAPRPGVPAGSVLRRAKRRRVDRRPSRRSRCALDDARLEALGVCRVVPPSRVAWGEVSQLAMVLRCLRWLLEFTDFDWVVLLSGQDYPIRPVAEIERSLAAADVDALIETRRCERPACGSEGRRVRRPLPLSLAALALERTHALDQRGREEGLACEGTRDAEREAGSA